jgi:hypothetical protein
MGLLATVLSIRLFGDRLSGLSVLCSFAYGAASFQFDVVAQRKWFQWISADYNSGLLDVAPPSEHSI